ncbi:MAG: FRG domain-containing protein [Candidatus Poribacteria bacterium]|nr:FRG domain-containing protein [Candidatus Poribacteria bacterium]
MEILAELQHLGAATCLIDFSHSAQIALWFACLIDSDTSQDTTQPNGKVFAIHNQPPRFKEISPKLLNQDIDFFLKDSNESQLYQWQPRHQNNRIIMQQSIFLFGNFEFDADHLG